MAARAAVARAGDADAEDAQLNPEQAVDPKP
jgi:hypothetical protein